MKTPSSARHRRAWRPTRAGAWAGTQTLVQLVCVCYLTLAGSLTFWTLLPLAAGWKPSVIVSGSMQPVIAPGDVVVTAAVEEVPGPGAVVLFDDPIRQGEFTTHRVVEVTDDGLLVTKGDANQSADSTPIAPEAVRGQGRLVVPAAGLPRLWWSTDRTRFAVWVGITAIAVIVVSRMPQSEPEPDAEPPVPTTASSAPPTPASTEAADPRVCDDQTRFEVCGFTPGLVESLPRNIFAPPARSAAAPAEVVAPEPDQRTAAPAPATGESAVATSSDLPSGVPTA